MISVILTAFKEERTVGKAIESIQNNKIGYDYEIIVVCPDEATSKVALRYNNVKHIKDLGKGKPHALNLALKEAEGDIIILTDGDVFIGEDSINKLIESFNNPKVGAVSGNPVSLNSRNDMFGFWSNLLTGVAHDLRSKTDDFVCSGYLMALRKGIVLNIPEDSLSDDAVISNLVLDGGYNLSYAPEAIVYVKYPDNFSDWVKQKVRSAGGYYQLKKFTKNNRKMRRSFISEALGIFKVFKYCKNFKEFLFTIILLFARLYLWFVIMIKLRVRKKDFGSLWTRIESTK